VAQGPSPRQVRSFKILNLAIYVLSASCVVSFGVSALGSGASLQYRALMLQGSLIAFAIAGVAAMLLLALFVTSLPYLTRLLRQRDQARKLGLWTTLEAPWLNQRRKSRWRLLLDMARNLVGVTLAIMGSGLGAVSCYGLAVGFSSSMNTAVSLGIVSIVLLGLASAIFLTAVASNAQGRLKLISDLRASLESARPLSAKQELGRPIDIPATTYEQIANMERVQISRSRVVSLTTGGDSSNLTYVLRKSRSAQQSQAGLDAEMRLRVQETIDSLMMYPPKEERANRSDDGIWHMPVEGTPTVIDYRVDDQNGLLEILSIRGDTRGDGLSMARNEK
jgi:hypothetical protein